MPDASEILAQLAEWHATLAVAESLTGGLLVDAFVQVPGASTVFRGGIVAYATDLKTELLGVDVRLLARTGPVDPQVALEMAVGVARRCGADVGVATTGVAGPDQQDGRDVGTVFVAVAGRLGDAIVAEVRPHRFGGDRPAVRAQAVDAAIDLLAEVLGGTG